MADAGDGGSVGDEVGAVVGHGVADAECDAGAPAGGDGNVLVVVAAGPQAATTSPTRIVVTKREIGERIPYLRTV